MNTCTLYLIRHAQSHSNAGTDTYSGSDGFGSHITETGQSQAEALATLLQAVPFKAIYASDLTRARQTADIVARPHNLQVIIDPALRERIYGRNESEINRANKDFNERYDQDESLTAAQKFDLKMNPAMESSREVLGRFIPCLAGISERYPQQTVAVVSHGNTLRTFLIECGFAKPRELPAGSFKNTGYAIISHTGGIFNVLHTEGINRGA